MSARLDADLLLEQRYDRYDSGFERPQPLLWFESRDKAAETPLTIDLKPLLVGGPPPDLILSVLFYADQKEMPEPVVAKYDPEQLSLMFVPVGMGRYLVEWSRPAPKTDSVVGGAESTDAPAAAMATEPALPQGWTPTYHAPQLEHTVPTGGGARTDRNHYYVGGQLIAVRVKTEQQAGSFYYLFSDRQGSVVAMRKADGTAVSGNTARYDAFGGYRTQPDHTANPGISDRGYTGHRMNNTGTNDLELIYMNARYYLPQIGRFISPDTIVPEPANPQSFNRYAYSYNNPVNYTDPSGHAPTDGCSHEGCSLTIKERRDFIHSYAQLLLGYRDVQNAPLSDVDIFAQIMDYAADFNTSMKEWANDLTSVVNKTTGVFTLISALGKGQTLAFGDVGFAPVFRDGQNQIYHWWAYVNTTVQGGRGGVILGVIGNEVHEFYDPTGVSRAPGKTGNSWEDYALAENGLAFGLQLHNGNITPKTASDAMRVALATDSRRPMVQWAMEHIPNSWLLPNIAQDFYYALSTYLGQP